MVEVHSIDSKHKPDKVKTCDISLANQSVVV